MIMGKKILFALLLLFVTACQNADATADPTAGPTATNPVVIGQPTAITVQSSEVMAAETAGVPVRLTAPALNFAVSIETMRWQVAEVEGNRQAIWEVPESSAGWHLNSAPPGTAGNMVLSGHHLLGAAVFAPLARGEFTVGTQLLINDDQGRTFLYQVSEVAQPLPVNGSAAEQTQAMAYLAPTEQSLLTLVTGWPDFSDTHYLFVRATFVGRLQ
jgi:hypothetical protein